MAVTQLEDVIVPVEFSNYIAQNTMEQTALFMSGVTVRNGVIESQLRAGADSFSVPFWLDLGNDEANLVTDDPDVSSAPKKINAAKQHVRKSFLHQSWSAMNLASELSGSDALQRIQDRATAYWNRQLQRRLIASLQGVMADNDANDSDDLIHDVSAEAGDAAKFSAAAVIDAAGTLGDSMDSLSAIAMHSDVYRSALKNDLLETIQDSQGRSFKTFRGLAVVVDDALVADGSGNYLSILFGPGAVGFGVTTPRIAKGTEIENLPSAGNGGGQQILHSRVNIAIHPAGFAWKEGTVVADSPSIAELALAANWDRVVERKAVNLAFLISKI